MIDTQERPLLLIDIDGVLAPWGGSTKRLKPIKGHFIAYDPAVPPMLHKLKEHYDLVWASMWQNGGNEVFVPEFDLEPMPYVSFRILPLKQRTYKLWEVKRFIEQRQMAWIDDDLHEDAFEWAEERDQTIPTKLIRTNSSVGMLEAHTQELMDWANEIRETNGN